MANPQLTQDLHAQQRTLDRLSSLPGVFYFLLALPVLDADVDARTRASAALGFALAVVTAVVVWVLPSATYSRWRTQTVIAVTLALAAVPHTRDIKVS